MKHSKDPGLVSRALDDLVSLIRFGVEFPDAIWTITHNLKVDHEALKDAYDQHCMEQQR